MADDHPEIVDKLTAAIVNWYAVNPNGVSRDFDAWMADPAFGLDPANRGFAHDPDGDGIPNGVEAWLGTHPGAKSRSFFALEPGGEITTFKHGRNFNPPAGLAASYQWSPNLVDWYAADGLDGPGDGTTVNSSGESLAETTTVVTTSNSPLDQLFLRLRVTGE